MAKRRKRATSASGDDWERLLRLVPGYDPFATAGDCAFDPRAADDVVGFFRDCLTHVKGALAGQPFLLADWQKAVVGNLFGWKRPDGTRRYREALIYVPRKAGKSLAASGIGLYALFCDGEKGAEIYVAAADRDQARLIWDIARRQIVNEPALRKACTLYQHSIAVESVGSSFKAISADAHTKHGYNSHVVIVDELHAQPTPDLVDVLQTSTGARRQPLIVYLTTADFERPSICNDKYAYACKVRDRVLDDPAFLPVIYEAKPDADWTDPAVWASANPNLDVSLPLEYLRRECGRALEQPSYQNTFKRLHLNMRTQADVAWFDIRQWDACGGPFHPGDLEGRPCFAGLDLASTQDLTALVLFFPADGNAVLPFFFAPEDTARLRERRDRVPYAAWARDGHLILTGGNVTDYDAVRAKARDLAGTFDIREVAYDRWGATQLVTQLQGDGFRMVEFGQGFASLGAPSKHLEKLVLSGGLRHDGHPLLRWNAANAMVETDAAGNIKPSKRKSRERIDGIVALVMAIGRAIAGPPPPVSSYEDGRTILC